VSQQKTAKVLMRNDVSKLSVHYAASLAAHGATPNGLLWPNATDLATRFEVLLGGIAFEKYSPASRIKLLDLGCGPGLLLDYLADNKLLDRVDYHGIDVLGASLLEARSRWPTHSFELRDVRDSPFAVERFDYCIVCGVFTGRFDVTYSEMETMARETLKAVWPSVKIGLAFNAMSKHVDWERDDLFHWPLDDIVAFCKANLSRHVSLRLDYGLWEASAIVRRLPVVANCRAPDCWTDGPISQG
jgi:SAM-dependent methyltransferase